MSDKRCPTCREGLTCLFSTRCPVAKTLGQVVFDVVNSEIQRHSSWNDCCVEEQEMWERAAQAVVAELVADVRSPESKAAFAIVGALLKAQGAAEERERLAQLKEASARDWEEDGNARMRDDCLEDADWLRAGGKP